MGVCVFAPPKKGFTPNMWYVHFVSGLEVFQGLLHGL